MEREARVIFITGGARSGKSRFALKLADSLHPLTSSPIQPLKAYIATAAALDDEMKERIERHKRERGQDWDTVEEPLDIVRALNDFSEYSVILLDCLTLWISNLMLNNREIEKDIERFLNCLGQHFTPSPLHPFTSPSTIIIVSNEVGMGIVPEGELARRFRDVAGMVNQKVAEIADEVYLVVSGIPMKIKG